MSPRVVPDHEPLWRALADPTRRALLDRLRSGPRTTGELAEAFPTTRFAVMKHLGVLFDAGLVTVERRGRERLNHLNPVPLRQAYDRWVRPLSATTADAVLRLAETAEETEMSMETYGLDVRASHLVRASADRTWASLVRLAQWWPPCWSDDRRLVFEPHVGGRLGTVPARATAFEAGELWGVVSRFEPGVALALDGSMGLPGPVLGQWRMALEETGSRETTVTVEHRILGQVDDEDRAGFTSGWPRTLAALDTHALEGAPS